MPWPCFLVHRTNRWRHSLRRYSTESCPLPHKYHDAQIVHGEPTEGEGSAISRLVTDEEKISLPWPTKCPCGYTFADADFWQHFPDLLFTDDAGSIECPLRELKPGAILEAPWLGYRPLSHTGTYVGPHLLVVLPGSPLNIWNVTGPAQNGPGWCVDGAPPMLTVSPSIKTPRYHGHLIDGCLSLDLDGNHY